MTEPALWARALRMSLGGRAVVDEVSVHLPQGGLLAVVGPNGAGKSTLGRLCAGLIQPDAGEIAIMGRPLGGLSRRAVARLVAHVPQPGATMQGYSVRETVSFARYPHLGWSGTLSRVDEEAVERALRLSGLEDLAHRDMGKLSGGERQLALMAAALAQETPLLILDEPAASLDPAHARELALLLRRIRRERQVSIVMITHDLNAALAQADEVLVLQAGRALFAGPAPQLADAALLQAAFGCPFTILPAALGPGMPAILPCQGGGP